jgi:hypothetical protein
MGGACGTYGREKCFWWEVLKKRDQLEHISVGRRIILKWFLMKQGGGHLNQDRNN